MRKRQTVYGVCWGDGADTQVRECMSEQDAHEQAQMVAATGTACDVVELEGTGPELDSDGQVISDTHAPSRTIRTVRAAADAAAEIV